MIRIFTICILTLAGLIAVAAANTPDPNLSFAEIPPAAVGAGLTVAPDGSWAPFTEAYDPFGALVDATITLTLLDSQGDPVVAYPVEDIWLETTNGGLVSCIGGTNPDWVTDMMGQTQWVDPLRAGGCSVGEMTVVYVQGDPLSSSPLDLVFRSFDFNGDLVVNLTDIVIFTQSIGSYHQCADYNNDGVISLSDIVRLTQGLGGDCN